MNVPTRLNALIDRQSGVIKREQALKLGMSPESIRHAIGPRGSWQKITPGIYATFTGQLYTEHKLLAAQLWAGPDAVLTGSYACRRYGMTYVPDSLIQLLVPLGVRRAPMRLATITRVSVMPRARTVRRIATAVPERAALDAARRSSTLQDVRAVICEVVQRRLATAERVAEELLRVDPRDMEFARRSVADLVAGCRSAPECELRDLVRTSEVLPEPVWNQPLPGSGGMIPDGYIEEVRLVLEVDSLEHHQVGDKPERTERRRARLASLGWRVYPVSPRRLRAEPAAVLAEIEAAAMLHSDHIT